MSLTTLQPLTTKPYKRRGPPVRVNGLHSFEARKRLLEEALGAPFEGGNAVELLSNGSVFGPAIDAINRATKSVELVVYVWWRGEIADRLGQALINAARRGVQTRILIDAIGGFWRKRSLFRQMRRAGVDVRLFRHPRRVLLRVYQRTHRKILVCDGQVAFTGGFGIDDRWTGDARTSKQWRDLHYRVTGPAVRSLRASFIHEWLETGGPLPADLGHEEWKRPMHKRRDGVLAMVISSVSTPGHSGAATLFEVCIRLARKRLRIVTPYFVPDQAFVEMLMDACSRGVEVEVLVPGRHIDHLVSRRAGERAYDKLLEAGAKISRYKPTMLHTKLLLIDDDISVVGSANFNQRSLRHDDEVQLVILDERFSETMKEETDGDLEQAEPVRISRWRGRSLIQRVEEKLASIVAYHV